MSGVGMGRGVWIGMRACVCRRQARWDFEKAATCGDGGIVIDVGDTAEEWQSRVRARGGGWRVWLVG